MTTELDRWERREITAFTVLPYALLAISLLLTLLARPEHLPAVLGLAASAALWLLRPGKGLHYTVLMALTAALVALAPFFGLFAFIGYPQAFLYLSGRGRYAGVAATATISAVAYLGGWAGIEAGAWWEWLTVSVLSVVLASAFFFFADLTHQRNDRLKEALQENADLHAQLLIHARAAGVLDERQRMAGEIHDTLAQGLAGIITQLQAAEHTMDRRHMTTAITLARESLAEARRTVHAVEPSLLAEAQLPGAVEELAHRWSQTNEIAATVTTTGDARPMHPDVEVALLRTAQEALTNVAKHARATEVTLTLSYMEDLVTLDVRDDGSGFDPTANRSPGTRHGGFGLTAMRHRLQRLTGHLTIESEPGAGTALSATVPAIPPQPTA
ncbi:sensor histidine kinase [Paractinoplanes atraurantiacus]|uniref:Oxygen sensor histidine kinase NreB n=1 Tax=Paractinoplanes atraurantiacus TaxID=1036182 RepID=A0A285JVH9_9ACTN|nr:sensor histidine kinase [Actinoplanes atraurantiacus]SNY64305.1 Signal transduction histidine kinase [Actinoplanes atraurantiacus]